MKKWLTVILAAGLGFVMASWRISRHLNTRNAAHLAEQQAAWQSERAALEAALAEAKIRVPVFPMPLASTPAAALAPPTKLSPEEIVAKLLALNSVSGDSTRTVRQAIHGLEGLIAAGPAALPAIRQFLARNEDIAFSSSKSTRGLNADIVPPSLRFGLFDAVKQIGGAEAEKLLAEILGTTGRGAEVEWLARTLQEMAPNKYRDSALAAARELLARADGHESVESA